MAVKNLVDIFKKSAEEKIDISESDIEVELARLYSRNDATGVVDLYNAFKDWASRCYKNSKSPFDIDRLVKTNLDYYCRNVDIGLRNNLCAIADNDLRNGTISRNAYESFITARPGIGNVQKFYRDTINYHPVDQKPLK